LSAREPLSTATLQEAALVLAQNYDWKHGGWGKAPKFPQPMAIEFLLRRAVQGDKLALDIADHALHAMAKGGMYDVVGGGFARYSTDDRWLVPHFEKMLYDNAQLALVYLHAHLLTGEAFFRRVCEETLDFVSRELTHPEGGFFSSLDADSEGEEGKFYLWTEHEIQQVLRNPEDIRFIKAAYGITNAGNFEQRTILQRQLDDKQLASQFNIVEKEVPIRLKDLHAQLLQARLSRIRPQTDDKVLTSWNALMLAAFAEAARYLKRPDYLAIAQSNAHFLMRWLYVNGRLLRSWREGRASHHAYLEDHAALVIGLLSLYQADADQTWFEAAKSLTGDLLAHFCDPAGGFFDTRDDHEALIYRPKDLQDNATPSGNSLAATALLLMSAYTGRGDWRDLAETTLAGIQSAARQYPTAFGYWLTATDFALAETKEVAILGDPKDVGRQALIDVVWSAFRPHLVVAISSDPPSENAPDLLRNRQMTLGKATAYVCRNFICQLPVTQPDELAGQLNA
jgi:hypothetical protein